MPVVKLAVPADEYKFSGIALFRAVVTTAKNGSIKSKAAIRGAFQTRFGLNIHESRREMVQKNPAAQQTEYDPAEFQSGTLLITDIGPQKLKVAQVLKRVFGLSVHDALILVAQSDVAVGHGSLIWLQSIHDQLTAAGAAVEFRPDAESRRHQGR